MADEQDRDYGECPVCTRKVPERSTEFRIYYKCDRCGPFSCTYEARRPLRAALETERHIANASGWIHEAHMSSISENEIPFLAGLRTPSVAERADKVLLYFEQTSATIDRQVQFIFDRPDLQPWISASWSATSQELNYLVIQYLYKHAGYLGGTLSEALGRLPFLLHAHITPAGYAHLQQLRMDGANSNIGFCAMWFKPNLTPLWTDAIAPAIKDAGYDPKRIDKIEHSNKIDDEIIATIRRSKFVVADFTGNRGGVYFEAGFANGLKIPIIWTVRTRRLHRIHFDTRQYNFLEWDGAGLGDFKSRLQYRIEALLGRGPFTP